MLKLAILLLLFSYQVSGQTIDTFVLRQSNGAGQAIDVKLATVAYVGALSPSDSIMVMNTSTRRRSLLAPADLKSNLQLNLVNNTSDANKPVSSATQTALNLKSNLASPTFTGTVAGVTASMVGLGSVTNESKATMFTSPTFTGGIIFPNNQVGIPVFARVTGSNATTTGQALVDITGLSVSLIANATYELEVMLSASTTAVTTGTGYGIQYSAAGATIEGWISGSATTTADKTLRLNAFNTSIQAYLTTSAQTGGIFIRGVVTVGANPGTLSARHLKVTSGTSTCFIGSYIKVTRIL